jgi:hypothetical protein
MKTTLRILLLLFIATTALAQNQNPVTGSLRVRVENWNWFETPGADDHYTFLGAQLRASMKRKFGRAEGTVEAAVPVLVNLPEHAIAAAPRGQLGLGASYYAANNNANEAGLVLKQAFLKYGSFRFGRMEFSEGGEHMPADAGLAAVRSARVANRLIGTFAFSHVGRSFDGVHFDKGPWTALAARPTAGGFRVDAGRTLDIGLLYGSWTHQTPASDARVFLIGYRDHRRTTKVDNRPAAQRVADYEDVRMTTIGGHWLAKFGATNALAWVALQGGEWGMLDHHAGALDLEVARTFGNLGLRAGWFRSSGDGNAADGDHETFFQVIPTNRGYARFPFYNAMNSNDGFLIGTWKPTAKLSLQTELHGLQLTEKNDLWYSGGGAYDGLAFGYAGRPSSGSDELATVIDLSADYKLNPTTSFTFYVARAQGGDVVSSIFAGETATYAYAEVVKRF